MDVARPPEVAQRKKRNRIIAGVAAALFILITTVALAQLKPAAPTVEASGLWIEPVKRGTMLRNVRGTGVLVPDEIRWITALTDGTVERVRRAARQRRRSRHRACRAQQSANAAGGDDGRSGSAYRQRQLRSAEGRSRARPARAARRGRGRLRRCRAGGDECRRRRADGEERIHLGDSTSPLAAARRNGCRAAEDGRAAAREQRAHARGKARRAAVRSASGARRWRRCGDRRRPV